MGSTTCSGYFARREADRSHGGNLGLGQPEQRRDGNCVLELQQVLVTSGVAGVGAYKIRFEVSLSQGQGSCLFMNRQSLGCMPATTGPRQKSEGSS